MPFNVGPFEVILLFVVVGGIGLLVLQSKVKAPPMATPQTVGGPSESSPPVESLDALIAQGWRIESESSDYVFLVKGQRVNHILHFLVGLFTLGAWWIVWLILAAKGGEERRTVKKA
ncbi:MAG: hypothetical protein OXI70_12180 [Chloroflexota bacterium]|nr:hypothetical protein [Chloroflexota bacterium]